MIIKLILFQSLLVIGLYSQDTFRPCQRRRRVTRNCNPNAQFRTFDGSCNNLINKERGSTNTPLLRLIGPLYDDTDGTPRGFGPRPNIPPPNQISQELFSVEQTNLDRGGRSVLFMTFGQFIDHDIAISPHESCSVTRCPRGDSAAFRYPCFPIKFNQNGPRCTPFARSRPICRQQGEVRDQFNKLTAFIDGSQIYGVSRQQSDRLRENDESGKLKIDDRGLLLVDDEFENCESRGGLCSLAGDERVDENVPLLTMHTLWVREHNRIATELKRIHPSWRGIRLFRTARKINIAQLQNIVFNEWLPEVVDPLGAYSGYNSSADPSVANAFSTAAFRFGHSLIPNRFSLLDKNFDRTRNPITLRNAFNNRPFVQRQGIESTMFGLIGNRSNPVDTGFAFGIARRLLRPPGDNTYMDLTAFNIQRGRDHGLPTYGAWRELCGQSSPTTFRALNRIMRSGARQAFQNLGQNPQDLDLFAAGISERPVRGKAVGPTFGCIIRNQFERLRNGDRFYFEADPFFNSARENAIKNVRMSRILCNNLNGIVSVQRNAFRTSNRRISCTNRRIGELDLSIF